MALRWILWGRGWYLLSWTLSHSPVCEPVQWRATLWQESLTNCGIPPVVLLSFHVFEVFRVFCKKWLFPLPSARAYLITWHVVITLHCKARLPGLDWDRNPGCTDIFEAMARGWEVASEAGSSHSACHLYLTVLLRFLKIIFTSHLKFVVQVFAWS